jgi:hypothetical protein
MRIFEATALAMHHHRMQADGQVRPLPSTAHLANQIHPNSKKHDLKQICHLKKRRACLILGA